MVVVGYSLLAAAKILDLILLFFTVIIIARTVLSWVSPDPYNPIVRFIHNVTEPVLYRIRSYLPLAYGGIDFSPIIVLLAIYFIKNVAVYRLSIFASTLVR